jgi:hypothetical protein
MTCNKTLSFNFTILQRKIDKISNYSITKEWGKENLCLYLCVLCKRKRKRKKRKKKKGGNDICLVDVDDHTGLCVNISRMTKVLAW